MDAERFRLLVARNIRQARWMRGLTQAQAAEACGLTRRYYEETERGERNPSVEGLFRIAAGLGVAVVDLVDVAGARSKLGERLDSMKLVAPPTGRKPKAKGRTAKAGPKKSA